MKIRPTGSRHCGRFVALRVLALALACAVPAHADDAPADTLPPAPVVAPPAAAVTAAPDTVAPSAVTGAVANPSITGTRMVRLNAESHNVVRSGPGERFSIVGVFPGRTTFPVTAKSGDWYHVRLSDTESGWIHASLCEEFDDLSDLEWKPNPKLFTRTGSYILTGYVGAYAFDRKSNSLVLGGRLGYYVFDRLQAEGGVGWTRVNRPAEIVESLFGLELEAEEFDMLFYHLLLTYEILPGRQMVPYLSGGVGSAIMQGESEPSFNIGAGVSLFLAKRTAVRWEFRHYSFTSGSADSRSTNNNIEFTVGTAVLF